MCDSGGVEGEPKENSGAVSARRADNPALLIDGIFFGVAPECGDAREVAGSSTHVGARGKSRRCPAHHSSDGTEGGDVLVAAV
jgi:hypothetical protein